MLKGRCFSSSSEVIQNATVELNKLRKFDFEQAFQQLFSRWKKCRVSARSRAHKGLQERSLARCPHNAAVAVNNPPWLPQLTFPSTVTSLHTSQPCLPETPPTSMAPVGWMACRILGVCNTSSSFVTGEIIHLGECPTWILVKMVSTAEFTREVEFIRFRMLITLGRRPCVNLRVQGSIGKCTLWIEHAFIFACFTLRLCKFKRRTNANLRVQGSIGKLHTLN
ncbi:hypothetical protein LAZ67_6003114 [Cordylochernes scorpioides]|uniref:Uncharacterized protein n=1 Tax=Cordylochernes scorpioides TaxID=51811 RepID=A0ABY6KQ99_9ARAC|nr:hypothetical protein LAZ67_6003114 [Cordylochernes scorpioides]